MNAKQPGTYAYEMFDTKDEKTRCGMADWIDTVEVNYDLDPQFEQNTVVAYEQYLQFGPMREDWKTSTSTDCEWKRKRTTKNKWSLLMQTLNNIVAGTECGSILWFRFCEMLQEQMRTMLTADRTQCMRRYFRRTSRLARFPVHGLLANILQHADGQIMHWDVETKSARSRFDAVLVSAGYFSKLLLVYIASFLDEDQLYILFSKGANGVCDFVTSTRDGFLFRAMRVRACMEEVQGDREMRNISRAIKLIPFCPMINPDDAKRTDHAARACVVCSDCIATHSLGPCDHSHVCEVAHHKEPKRWRPCIL